MIAKLKPKVTEQNFPEEKRKTHREMRDKRKRVMEKIGKGMDTNGDGEVSKAELVDYVLLLEERIEMIEQVIKNKLANR
jgi:hypothetical protein